MKARHHLTNTRAGRETHERLFQRTVLVGTAEGEKIRARKLTVTWNEGNMPILGLARLRLDEQRGRKREKRYRYTVPSRSKQLFPEFGRSQLYTFVSQFGIYSVRSVCFRAKAIAPSSMVSLALEALSDILMTFGNRFRQKVTSSDL
jgi:hypothetical protein